MGKGRCASVLLVLCFAAGCGGDAEPTVDASVAIEEFVTAPDAGAGPRSRVNAAVLAEPAASREAALGRLDSESPDVRLAAAYALSITMKLEDAEALAPLLDSADPAERVLAAAGMLAVGDKRAVPVLVAALGLDDPLPFGSPPLRAWEQARFALLAFTGRDFGLRTAATAAEAAATAAEWESWWATAEGSFEVVRAPGLLDP
jgi:hypothetical protein